MPAFDIIHTLIFGHDLPYLVKAVDPFTLAIIAQAVGSGIKSFRDKKEAQDIQQKGEEAYDDYSQKLLDIAKQERSVDQGFYDLEQNIRKMNEARRLDIENQANRAEATLLRNVNNPRAAANINEALTNLGRGTDQALLGTRQGDIDAQATTLAQEQRVADENFNRLFDMESFLYGNELQRAAASAEAGRQQGIDASNLMIDTIPDALTAFGNLQSVPGSGVDPTKTAQELGLTTIQEDGGIVKAKAGAAFVTPGEFSHETNPQNVRAEEGKMIFENKKGEDIAEVTGQEIIVKDKGEEEGVVVIDPNTAVSMEELVEKGDKEGLFEFFKNFFMKKKEEQEEHEAMKEQMQEENV
jgi:hypothetical protein